MISRFRLEQKSYYERLVIAQRLTDMLEKFLDGRRAPIAIGAEQGGIKEWDDVVIVHSPDSYEHLQVKRQATDFCTKSPNMQEHLINAAKRLNARNKKTTVPPPNTHVLSKASALNTETENISVLDSVFQNLAKYARSDASCELPERQFQLALSGGHVKIKKNLSVNHLDELCKLCSQEGVELDQLAQREDGPTKNAYLWLTTWCGFENWEQIREALRHVKVVYLGNETTLEQRSIDSLGRHYTDPKHTLERLITYITAEASDTSRLTCHAIAMKLKDNLRSDVVTWTQYVLGDGNQLGSSYWAFTGTHDLRGPVAISSEGVAQHMWSTVHGNRNLRIYAQNAPSTGINLSLPSALLRMALHLQNGSQGLFLGEPTWRGSVGHEIGHTLGTAANDLNYLPWLENHESLPCAFDKEFKTISAVREEAAALSLAMDDIVWQQLVEGVSQKLNDVSDPPLTTAMEHIWLEWLVDFAKEPKNRREFLEQLLYPETEGKNADQALRLGPRTVELLVTAVETLLLVAVGVGCSGSKWAFFPGCGEVLVIALKFWSGPANFAPVVRELSDDPLLTVIGPSPASVVILSGVSTSPTDMSNTRMADDSEMTTSMAAERRPNLLVTRYRAFQHLQHGTLDTVQQHFTKQREDLSLARQLAIETNSKGH